MIRQEKADSHHDEQGGKEYDEVRYAQTREYRIHHQPELLKLVLIGR